MSTQKTSPVGNETINASTPESHHHTSSSIPPKINLDTQVKAKQVAPRRTFSTAYKLKILTAYEACKTPLERGKLLRHEGLYSSRITTWRNQRDAGKLGTKNINKPTKKMQQLSRENTHLKKKLAQAEAIIDLQKKVSDLLGQHILPLEKNEEHS